MSSLNVPLFEIDLDRQYDLPAYSRRQHLPEEVLSEVLAVDYAFISVLKV